MSCAVCGRDARGFGLKDPWGTRRKACSITCIDILYLRKGTMPGLTPYEQTAIEAASDAAGAYLEEIGKTDLATMSGSEWRGFLKVVFTTSCAEVQRQADAEATFLSRASA